MNIFVSHRLEDTRFAKTFQYYLEGLSNNRLKVFLSEEIPGGAEWRRSIHDAIRESSIFLFVYTDEQADWTWCIYEAALYRGRHLDTSSHLIGVKAPSISFYPEQLNDLQFYEATQDDIRRFLHDLFIDGKFTDQRPIAPNLVATRNRLLQEGVHALSQLFARDRREVLFNSHRIAIEIINEEKRQEIMRKISDTDHIDLAKLLLRETIISGEIMTMALIGLSSSKSSWSDLIKIYSLRDRPLWTSELENILADMLSGRSLSSERQVFSPFIARNRIRYLPVLGRMELVGGVPSSVSLIFIEMSAFWADPFQMSLRGVPPRIMAIERLLDLCRAFRWDVLNPFFNMVQQAASTEKEDGTPWADKENETQKFLQALVRLEKESETMHFTDQNYLLAVLDLQESHSVANVYSEYNSIRRRLEGVLAAEDLSCIKSILQDLRRMNKAFMILCLDLYVSEIERLAPVDLGIDAIRDAWARHQD